MTTQHVQRKILKNLKRELQLAQRERSMGLRDLRWVDAKRLPE